MATTVTADDTSVTFTALHGQVVTFSEYSTNAAFTRTDSNNGGCAAGDRGRLTGISISHIVNHLNCTSIGSRTEGSLTWRATSLSPQRHALKLALKSQELSLPALPAIRPYRLRTEEPGHTD
jgi:hypothetical protein